MSTYEDVRNYVVLDLETTGFGVDCEIIEIAAVKVVNDKIAEEFTELIKPNQPISDGITRLTGINNRMVSNCRGVGEVLRDFFMFIGDYILVGHNIRNFDYPVLSYNFSAYCEHELKNDMIDTLELSKEIPLKSHTLETMCDYFGILNSEAHRALSDVKATDEIFRRLKRGERNPDYQEKERSKKKYSMFISARDISADTVEFDKSHPLFEKVCVLTGVFSDSRSFIMQAIANVGGINADNVTKKTNYLVLGSSDPSTHQGGYGGSKWQKASEYIKKGSPIEIISEVDLYKMLNMEAQNV